MFCLSTKTIPIRNESVFFVRCVLIRFLKDITNDKIKCHSPVTLVRLNPERPEYN